MKINMKVNILAILIFLILGKTTQAQLLWYADPNKPYTDNFYNLNREPNEEGTSAVMIDSKYGKVWKVNKPVGSKRTEFSRTQPKEPTGVNTYIPNEGDSVYTGWRWKGEIEGSEFPAKEFAIFQNKSQHNASQNHPVNIDWDGKEMMLKIVKQGTGSVGSRSSIIWKKAIPENQWVAIMLKMTYSRDAKVGSVELWIDGEKQNLVGQNNDTERRIFHRTLDDEGNYSKWGAYNEASRNFNITVYLDEMRVAKDFETANPDKYK